MGREKELVTNDGQDLVPLTGDNSKLLRSAFGHFPCGVVGICALVDGVRTGMVASSFTVGVSMDPPLVLFAVKKASNTWPVLRQAKFMGISVLGETHHEATRQLSSPGERFAGLDIFETKEGAIFIEEAPVWMNCEIYAETPAGDHDVVVMKVNSLRVELDKQPLVWHGSTFRSLVAA